MTDGAIRGMLASLGDVGLTTYLTREEFAELEKNISGELYGIGARLTLRKGRPTIVQTFPGSPAREAGSSPAMFWTKWRAPMFAACHYGCAG